MPKKRLDIALSEQTGISRTHAQSLILSGKVLVNDVLITKAGYFVNSEDVIIARDEKKFVSRGGDKLLGAVKYFNLDFTGLVCLDIGASTGGFTDCMLKNGSRKVYAVDVGYGQLDWNLRNDKRVVCIERQNIRHWDWHEVADSIDFVTIDVSFISLEKVFPVIPKHITNSCSILALIKPQFEVGSDKIAKGGVVREENYRQEAIEKVKHCAVNIGFEIKGICESPLKGPAGNQEYFIFLKHKS